MSYVKDLGVRTALRDTDYLLYQVGYHHYPCVIDCNIKLEKRCHYSSPGSQRRVR